MSVRVYTRLVNECVRSHSNANAYIFSNANANVLSSHSNAHSHQGVHSLIRVYTL